VLPSTNSVSDFVNRKCRERAGVNLLTYVGPGEEHNVLSDGPFYTETANGEKLVDWVARLIEGKPVGDVHCQKCRVG
jgi:hypothetical protein